MSAVSHGILLGLASGVAGRAVAAVLSNIVLNRMPDLGRPESVRVV